MKRLVQWHKGLMNDIADRFGLSAYQIVWIGFLKGVVLGYAAGVLL